MGDFMKYSHSTAMTVFYKIVKLTKNGVLMTIHIYAKDLLAQQSLGIIPNSKNNNTINSV